MVSNAASRLRTLKKKSTWYQMLLREVKKGHITKRVAEQRFLKYAEVKDSCIKEGHSSPNVEREDHHVFWTKRFKHATEKKIPTPNQPNYLSHERNRKNLGAK